MASAPTPRSTEKSVQQRHARVAERGKHLPSPKSLLPPSVNSAESTSNGASIEAWSARTSIRSRVAFLTARYPRVMGWISPGEKRSSAQTGPF